MTVRITAIVPTFCRRVLLERAVRSVLDQGDCVSVQVFDNASTDDTEETMRRLVDLDRRIKYHRHASNIGGAANFEYGLSSVDTEFFSILSDDDYLLPGFYDEALKALDADPEAMFWAGCTLHVDESDVVVEARVEKWPRHGKFRGEEGVMSMTHGRAPTWTGILFRRAVLDELGPPDREAGGPSDLDFTLRSAAHWPFIISKHPSAVFTLNAESFSSTQPLSSFWPGWIHMISNVRRWPMLDTEAKERIATALEEDARRMLFRRGVFAMVGGRRDFADDAARILRATPEGRLAGWMLGAAVLVVRFAPARSALVTIYRWLEKRLLRQRGDLQHRHGSLLRPIGMPLRKLAGHAEHCAK